MKAKIEFATIMDEVVQQFTAQLGVEVTIAVEIESKKKDGFDESSTFLMVYLWLEWYSVARR